MSGAELNDHFLIRSKLHITGKNSCHCQLGQKGIARKGRKGIVTGGEATDDVLLNGCDVPAKMPTEYSC